MSLQVKRHLANRENPAQNRENLEKSDAQANLSVLTGVTVKILLLSSRENLANRVNPAL